MHHSHAMLLKEFGNQLPLRAKQADITLMLAASCPKEHTPARNDEPRRLHRVLSLQVCKPCASTPRNAGAQEFPAPLSQNPNRPTLNSRQE